MRAKYLLLLLIFFSYSVIFSQSEKHNSWIIDLNENVNLPFTDKELGYIESAYDYEVLKKIKKIKALEINIKDILRNRVQVLSKKYNINETITLLSTVKSIKKKLNFNPKDFNPLLYDFDFDKNQIFRVDGTDYIINIIPKQLR